MSVNHLLLYPLLLLVVISIQGCTDPSTKLFDLYKESEAFEEEVRDRGDDRFYVQSPEELEEEYQFWTGIQEQLQQVNRDALSEDDKISYDIFMRDVEKEVKDYEFNDYLFRINHEGGFHTRPVGMASRMRADSLEDYDNYIGRLNSMPDYFEQNISYMRQGIDEGFVLPQAVMIEEYKETITSQIVDDPEASTFFNPVRSFPDFVPESERSRIREEVLSAIEDSVIPSYQKFLEFMEQEYMPNARENIAHTSLPGGEEYYNYLVNYYTTLDITAEEVHEIGMDEVERIRSEMEAIIEEVNFQGSFDEFLQFLRTDSQFYVEEPEDLMEKAAHFAKKMDGKLPQLFNMLPREPYGIEPVPDHLAPRYTGGRYSPARSETDAGYYWVNTYNLPSRPLYTLEALTYHEAAPGHHLQIALADELEDLSEIRQQAGVTAFVEGWALYSERLGLEAGFYQDPYSNFGRLTYEMWRACRLVVDTGMHALGWSRDEAVDFMTENTALSHHEIDTEINRYIATPGQALAYKMGELKIRELRAEAEEQLGGKFDVRKFHDAVLLGGSVPLPVLERQVQAYIEETENEM